MRDFIGGILATIQYYREGLVAALVVGIWVTVAILMLLEVTR